MTLLAAMLALSPAAALSKKGPERHQKRVGSHISLHVSTHQVVGDQRIVLRGRVRPRGSHRVKVVVRGPRGAVLGEARSRRGAFALSWRPKRLGTYRVRAYGIHDRRVRGSASPSRRVTAYHYANASYYGPGLYGNGMACGGTLLPGTLGVANKTLPCGTMVTLRYRGRTVTVPVVDRGPYVAGRDFDLTTATRDRLHFPGVGTVLSSR
jgi:rare lipoprotein A (peptidoglycan hydrolase)